MSCIYASNQTFQFTIFNCKIYSYLYTLCVISIAQPEYKVIKKLNKNFKASPQVLKTFQRCMQQSDRNQHCNIIIDWMANLWKCFHQKTGQMLGHRLYLHISTWLKQGYNYLSFHVEAGVLIPVILSGSNENMDGDGHEKQMNGGVPEKQIQHRANTTMHVCWHRNTSVSMRDHDKAIKVKKLDHQ